MTKRRKEKEQQYLDGTVKCNLMMIERMNVFILDSKFDFTGKYMVFNDLF